jgi:hypothetical protein
LNPVRIKAHSNKSIDEKIRLLGLYRYSSLGGYIHLKERVDFINYRKVLDCFIGDTPEGRKRYRQFVYKGLGEDLESFSEIGKNRGIVGGPEFVEYIRQTYLDKVSGKSHRERRWTQSIGQPDRAVKL